MPVDSKHPKWADRAEEWRIMRDAVRGETAVKEQGSFYLPIPSGFDKNPDPEIGRAMYSAYMLRAQFPEITNPTVRGMLGVIHRNEMSIEGLDETGLEYLWERATPDGLPLEAFHRRITRELLVVGRYGVLTDVPEGGGDPYLVGYAAENLINWSNERDMFVLDESRDERRGEFEWQSVKRYRVLRLRDGSYTQQLYGPDAEEGGELLTPRQRASQAALIEIPFVTIGSMDLSTDPDDPPLIGVARPALAIYRLDADYRHQLYMSGQETLVVINGNAPPAVGAGVVVTLKGDVGITPDAKYVGPAGTGIAAHRQAILDERENAAAAGARLFEADAKKTAESGDALRIRYAAQTATLQSIAQASASGLERALRYAALMIGSDPTKIIVTPPKKLVESTMTPTEAAELVKVWQSGAIAKQTLYENLQRGEIASAERDFEEEEGLIEDEGPPLGTIPVDPRLGSQQQGAGTQQE